MEIKVGDKVRVREDAPRLYTDGWSCNWLNCDVYVTKIDGDAAEVKKICDDDEWYYLNIPLKYLTKVEPEAKAPKFKDGDKAILKGFVCTIIGTVYSKGAFAGYIITSPKLYGDITVPESDLEPCTESAEEKIIRQREAELNEFAKEELDRVHHPEKYATYDVTVDNVTMNWQRYEADLAKEIAIVYAKQKRDVRMAVRAAKSVVEELKKK